MPTTPGTVLSDEDLEIYYALNMVAQKVYMLQVRWYKKCFNVLLYTRHENSDIELPYPFQIAAVTKPHKLRGLT